MTILDGKKLKNEILEDLKQIVCKLNKKPSLTVIQIGNDEASNVYIKQKENMCNFVGYTFNHIKLEDTTREENVLQIIEELNNNDNVNAILVQMPISKHLNYKKIQNKINPLKDVDGLTNENKLRLINKEEGLFPCTALGVIELLNNYNISVEGKNITIVGRSDLVGMPLFHILNNMNATVTLCHSKTKNLEEKTKQTDILVVATGKKHLIKENMVKENSTIIDVGINKENNKLYGDVDFDNIKNKVSYITPVPGGVGPMTIAMLAKNILKAYKMQKNID